MSRVFKHSGATGDIIYSLPVIKDMGGGALTITMPDIQLAESIKKLIELQPYITSVSIGNADYYTNDLDKFREVFHGAYDSIIEAHYRSQAISPGFNYKDGWLTLPGNIEFFPGTRYSVINRTERYNDYNCNWAAELEYLRTISDEIYFIGYEHECKVFSERFGEVKFLQVDFLQGAYLIQNAVMYTGGYSAWSTIAQGLGIPYRLEQAPGHTCSSFFVEREKIINL